MGFFIDEDTAAPAANPGGGIPGGFFIDEQPETPKYSGPTLFNDPIGALTSADWWLTRPSGERISMGQAVTGPLTAANNAVNPLGDETIAGGTALLDMLGGENIGDAYDRRLAEARGAEASFDKASPAASIGLDVLGAFKLPTKLNPRGQVGIGPLTKSQALIDGSALTRIGQALKEGAGWGAAFGFGNGEGAENRVGNAALGGTIGGALAGTLGTASEGVRKVLSIGDAFPGLADVLSKTPEEQAGSILRGAAGPEILNLKIDKKNPLASYRTLAEATQNPNLAQLEQSVGKDSAAANTLLQKNLQDRMRAQKVVLQGLSAEPKKTAEAGGETLRGILEPKAQAAKDQIDKLFSGISPKNKVVIAPVRDAFFNDMRSTYLAGGAPPKLQGIATEMASLVDSKGKDVPFPPYKYVKALRTRAQNAWVDARDSGDDVAKRVAGGLISSIDSAIEQSASVGLFSPKDVAQYKLAKKTAEKYFDTFGMKGVGPAITKLKEGQYLSDASNVVENAFNGTAEGTKRVLRAVGKDPKEIDKVRGGVRDLLFRLGSDNDTNLRPGRFRTVLREYEEGLNAALPDGTRLMEKNHLTALRHLTDELALLDPQSATSVKQLANTASRGQPTTAAALMTRSIASRFLGASGTLVGKLDEWFAKSRQDQIHALLGAAFVDADMAKALVSAPTKATTSRILPRLIRGLERLEATAPQSGRLGSAISGAYTGKAVPQGAAQSQERKSSPNSTTSLIDKAMSNAEAKLDAPKVISAQRVSAKAPSADTNIDSLVARVIRQESSGNTKAVSSKGAQGLMQLMPATGKEMMTELGMDAKDYDPFDPKLNKVLGTAYLKKMLGYFDGDERLALAAYNAGPGRVKKLLAAHGNSFAAIESHLPAETRAYVRRITSSRKTDQVKA